MFKHASPQEAQAITYVIQGRLGPPYKTLDIGIDERGITRCLAKLGNRSFEAVWTLYKDLGDLGLVANKILPEQGKMLTVYKVYDLLVQISKCTGPGSAEMKLNLLVQLLSQLSKLEARFLVRIVAGKLRLGVGDTTIIEALVQCIGKPEFHNQALYAYAFTSDLGLIACTILSEGPVGIAKISPAPGRPIFPALAQRVPAPADAVKKIGRLIVEPKYDGLRLQLHKDKDMIWLFTRRLENITQALPDLVQAAKQQITATQAILDGEVVGFNSKTGQFLPFQQTLRRKRKYKIEKMEFLYPIHYYVFDLLFLDGNDLTPKPLYQRLQLLRNNIKTTPQGPIFITPQLETQSADELVKFLDQMLNQGYEGVMAKRPDAPYHAGARLYNWIKLKRSYKTEMADTFDLVVVGYFKGRGKRAPLGIGSLLCTVYGPNTDLFRTVSRVGSGFTDKEWLEFRKKLDKIKTISKPRQVDSLITPDVWVEPRFVIEVIANEVTRSPKHTCGKVNKQKGYSLRFPRFSRFRFDRRSQDATTESEIIEFYQSRAKGKTQYETK